MKGLVFTEFLEMVEKKFSPQIVDQIIEESNLASSGAYTTLGNYDYREMLQLVSHLSKHTQIPAKELVQTFGRELFRSFVKNFSHFFTGLRDAFEFLRHVEDYIHIEVTKLYPKAELPTFKFEQKAPHHLELTYRSKRPFADLAHGLIEGCILHYQEEISVEREDLTTDGTAAKFTLKKS